MNIPTWVGEYAEFYYRFWELNPYVCGTSASCTSRLTTVPDYRLKVRSQYFFYNFTSYKKDVIYKNLLFTACDDSACLKCDVGEKECSQCKAAYYLTDNKDCANCPSLCNACGDSKSCSSCSIGTYWDGEAFTCKRKQSINKFSSRSLI